MLFDNLAAYAFDKKVFGKIVEYSAIKGELTVEDADGNLHVSKDSIVLAKIGTLNDVDVFDADVIQENDRKYEIQLLEDGMLLIYALDDKLNRIGTPFKTTKEKLFNCLIELVGNVYELRDKLPKVDFNVKVVKSFDGTGYTYFYACNNKETEEVDLIKVLFFGNKILNEDYERKTLSYDAYLDSIANGTLQEVSEKEFSNYVLGVSYEAKKLNSKLQEMMSNRAKEDDFMNEDETNEDEWDTEEEW